MKPPFKCIIYAENEGKIVGEFICDEIIEVNCRDDIYANTMSCNKVITEYFAKKACVTPKSLRKYQGERENIYLWHIKDAKKYKCPIKFTKTPPRSWCYIEAKEQREEKEVAEVELAKAAIDTMCDSVEIPEEIKNSDDPLEALHNMAEEVLPAETKATEPEAELSLTVKGWIKEFLVNEIVDKTLEGKQSPEIDQYINWLSARVEEVS